MTKSKTDGKIIVHTYACKNTHAVNQNNYITYTNKIKLTKWHRESR